MATSLESAVESSIYAKLAQLPDELIRQDLIKWFKNSNEVKIFISGKTGVGKSTLVNGLVGEKVAVGGDTLDPETSVVKSYKGVHGSVHVTVWDTPGLQDGTKNEAKYLADMKDKCSDMDVFIYCVSMKKTRFFKGCADIIAMKNLTKVFGKKIWKNSMLVLTFANLAGDIEIAIFSADNNETKVRLFKERVDLWRKTLVGALVEDVGLKKEVVERIKVIPAGYATEPTLMDRENWLSPFWFATLYAMHPRAMPAMVKLNYHRIVDKKEDIRGEDLKEFIQKQPLIFSQRGTLIGAKYGMSGSGKTVGLSMGKYASLELKLALEMHIYFM